MRLPPAHTYRKTSMLKPLIRALPDGPVRRRVEAARSLMPGILVASTIALAATFLSDHYGGPVMLFALLLGMAFNFLSADANCRPGIDFSARTILRVGVALLGARITVEAAASLGLLPILLAVGGVVATIAVGMALARLFGFETRFGLLTGGAVGICGASAALAIASVLPKGRESDTIFTVIAVTTLSTIAMVAYPIALQSAGWNDIWAGVFLGATIHDVAQVVGAGYSISTEAGDAATLTKLLRVSMLVPVVLAMSFVVAQRGQGSAAPRLPAFLVAFVVLVIVNSLGLITPLMREFASDVSRWALVAAIAALGVKTMLGDVMKVGPKAMLLVIIETAWIAGLAMIAILWLG